jgi:hypothetical protein
MRASNRMKSVVWLLMIWVPLSEAQRPPATEDQHPSVPPAVTEAFKARRLDGRYQVSFHLSPFYLEGDFNGDGKRDTAVLVRERKTGKIGIAIVHSGRNDVFIVGAGKTTGNGGDNFDWMDSWSVYAKKDARGGAGKGPRLKGDGLLVERTESASGLIYWNGAKYVWRQMGD